MENGNANSEAQVQEKRATTVKERSAWVRRHLSGSIYLWACGEKAENQDDDVLKLSDRLIGWVVLLMQGLLYAALFYRAGRASSSSSSDTGMDDDFDDEGGSGQSGYQVGSAFPALYLLIATTLPDLRAGFSLVGNGARAGHRVFGSGLLVVYGLMICTAVKVLTSAGNYDDATVVLNAVLVLFVADLDAKALAFFSAVPQERRLFWAIYSVWISYVLAVVVVVYFKDSSSDNDLDIFPSWFYLAVSPAAATLCSVVLSNALHNFLESCSEACDSVDNVTFGFVVSRARVGFVGALQGAKERFGEDPCFYAARTLWLGFGVVIWWFLSFLFLFPVAVDVPPFQIDEGDDYERLTLTKNLPALIFSIAVLVAGLALKASSRGCLLPRQALSADHLLGEPSTSDTSATRQRCGSCAEDARVPSLVVGWGVGYWVTSLLYVLGGALHGGGWTSAPIAVTVVGYVILPCFFLVGFLMMTDTKLLGERLGTFIKPALDALKDKRRVWYWILATVLRDVLLLWVFLSLALLALFATYSQYS